MHVFGAHILFPKAVNITGNLVPTIKKGTLRIYPYLSGYHDGVKSHYFTSLPPNNASVIVNSLNELLTNYPEKHEIIYKNCWLENPTPENPCFFDSSWVKEVCTSNHSYGYEEKDGYYSPCFIMRLENTEDWIPGFIQSDPNAVMDNYEQGFVPVQCIAKTPEGEDSPPLITVYPPKGFSHLFFPVNGFNQDRYLLPMVAVKLNRIRKAERVTLECSVDAPNAFFLWNNGRAVIRFETM